MGIFLVDTWIILCDIGISFLKNENLLLNNWDTLLKLKVLRLNYNIFIQHCHTKIIKTRMGSTKWTYHIERSFTTNYFLLILVFILLVSAWVLFEGMLSPLVPLNKLGDIIGLRPATLLKKWLWHRCFPVNFAKFLRLQKTSGGCFCKELTAITH